MATNPTSSHEPGLLLGGKFGENGNKTQQSPEGSLAETIAFKDGYDSICPGGMYRIEEVSAIRREPGFLGLHNLHETVISRTLHPPATKDDAPKRRAMLWDVAAKAVQEALVGIPAGSLINVCANR